MQMRFERTVLLIDDDHDDLEMLQEALKSIDADHTIVEAHNGIEGLEKLQELAAAETLPCLIVLDINMPKMDGRQTFISLKSDDRFSTIPVVIFSTSSSLLDRTFFEHHKTAYLVKPINFMELARTASSMINICFHRSQNTN
jgi:CheY-like chemotaxis protein